jgi:hypothetical protein
MTDPTPIKRRGRPPGSKNKIGGGKSIPPESREEYGRIIGHPAPESNALTLGKQITGEPPFIMPLTELQSTPGLPVKLRKSRQAQSFGDTSKTYNDPAEQEIEWPAGWPLPTTGQVVLGPISGQTNSVEFDLDNRVILITLR